MIEDFQQADKQSAIDLLATRHPAEYRGSKETIWDWQFQDNPDRHLAGAGIIARMDDRIVAFNGYMPFRLRYQHREMPSLWSCDTIVHPDCRGKGIGGKLIEHLKPQTDIVVGLGISDVQSFAMLKRGFQASEEIDQFFRVNRPKGLRAWIKWLAQLVQQIRSGAPTRNTDQKYQMSITEVSELGSEVDQLWQRYEDQYPKAVIRDKRYLDWKYGGHPLARYQAIVVKQEGQLKALAIFRHNDTLSRLLDYIGPANDAGLKRDILLAFKRACHDAALLECTTTDTGFRHALLSLGYRPYKKKPRFYVFSNIEGDAEPQNGWFIMGGDSDNDLGEFHHFPA